MHLVGGTDKLQFILTKHCWFCTNIDLIISILKQHLREISQKFTSWLIFEIEAGSLTVIRKFSKCTDQITFWYFKTVVWDGKYLQTFGYMCIVDMGIVEYFVKAANYEDRKYLISFSNTNGHLWCNCLEETRPHPFDCSSKVYTNFALKRYYCWKFIETIDYIHYMFVGHTKLLEMDVRVNGGIYLVRMVRSRKFGTPMYKTMAFTASEGV